MGNWRQGAEEEERRKAEEMRARNEVYERVAMDVELDLLPPPKAYTVLENASTDHE